MFAAAKKVNNLVWLVDYNKKQLDGYVKDILEPFDFEKKFSAFGFDAVTIIGNDIEKLYEVLTKPAGDRPLAVILDTVKGSGVKEVEDTVSNHSMNVGPELCDKWLSQLNEELASLRKEAGK